MGQNTDNTDHCTCTLALAALHLHDYNRICLFQISHDFQIQISEKSVYEVEQRIPIILVPYVNKVSEEYATPLGIQEL